MPGVMVTDQSREKEELANEKEPPPENAEIELSLLDGASSQYPVITPELEYQKKVASNKNCSLEDRLEAFEDIFDSEVGDTNMARARNIEREFGLRQIFLKFDGGNPTGTQKDRIAFAQAMDAMRRGYETITAVSYTHLTLPTN